MSRNAQTIAGAALIALSCAAGAWMDQYWLSLGIVILGNIILALSWNITASAGLVSIGHAAFWGIGAYTAANLQVHFGWPLVPTLAAGALTALVGGLVIGVVTTRLRRFYFAIATIAFAEALRVAAVMLPSLTGGASGMFLVDANLPSIATIYYVYVALVALTFAAAVWLVRSRTWFALTAMRENEDAARMLGIGPSSYRLVAICLSIIWAGAAGAASVYLTRYVAPDTVLVLPISVQAQVAPIAGGLYTLLGPILGALLLSGGSEYLRTVLPPGANLIVYGLGLILFIIFLPQGIVGALGDLLARRRLPTVGGSRGVGTVEPPGTWRPGKSLEKG